MRLWHKDLIPVLPKKQLVAQWRELNTIIGSINKKGTPNHLLVNKVVDYPPLHFIIYTNAIITEMCNRDYKISKRSYEKLALQLDMNMDKFNIHTFMYVPDGIHDIYRDWHTDRYLTQCYCNLQEKYDCGGIPKDEWDKVEKFYKERLDVISAKAN